MADTKETYRFKGRSDGLPIQRLVLSGSTDNPEEYVDLNGIVDLSEEQLEDYKNTGLKFTKLSEDDAKKVKQQQLDSVSAAAKRRGADQMDPQAVLAARRVEEESKKASESASAPSGDAGTGSSGSGANSGDNNPAAGAGKAPSGGKS